MHVSSAHMLEVAETSRTRTRCYDVRCRAARLQGIAYSIYECVVQHMKKVQVQHKYSTSPVEGVDEKQIPGYTYRSRSLPVGV